MDPILLLVIVVFVLLVLFAIGQRSQRNSTTPGDAITSEDTFEFEEDSENVTPTARRKTKIVAPTQRAAKGKLQIRALPLPGLAGATPPPEKGIDAILVNVLNPSARFASDDAQVFDFDPPLTLVVRYKAEDEKATTLKNGTPQLSLATVYQSDKGWRFERLDTSVQPDADGNGGTLTAYLKTLHPNDPVVMCRP